MADKTSTGKNPVHTAVKDDDVEQETTDSVGVSATEESTEENAAPLQDGSEGTVVEKDGPEESKENIASKIFMAIAAGSVVAASAGAVVVCRKKK